MPLDTENDEPFIQSRPDGTVRVLNEQRLRARLDAAKVVSITSTKNFVPEYIQKMSQEEILKALQEPLDLEEYTRSNK